MKRKTRGELIAPPSGRARFQRIIHEMMIATAATAPRGGGPPAGEGRHNRGQTTERLPALDPLLIMVGDSMEPRIRNGDMLWVDTSDRRVCGDAIYVLEFGGSVVVKRLQTLHDGTVVATCDNPAYEKEEIPPREAKTLFVLGRVALIGNLV